MTMPTIERRRKENKAMRKKEIDRRRVLRKMLEKGKRKAKTKVENEMEL